MSEKPILFSGPMVRAILDGRKTMTRRVAKIVGISGTKCAITAAGERLIELEDGEFQQGIFHYESLSALSGPYHLPYKVGDLLWVRETWQTHCDQDQIKPSKLPVGSAIQYPATYDGWVSKKRPSMFMPRWASRITLRVTAVKIECLQDISEDDCRAEGIIRGSDGWWGWGEDGSDNNEASQPDEAFKLLWQSVNGPGSWEKNPWVAAYSFQLANHTEGEK